MAGKRPHPVAQTMQDSGKQLEPLRAVRAALGHRPTALVLLQTELGGDRLLDGHWQDAEADVTMLG